MRRPIEINFGQGEVYCEGGTLEGFSDILQQFTGMKNKNGSDYYEGDIVTYAGASKGVGDIVWCEDGFVINAKDGNDKVYLPLYKARDIIGNIYENPELLNV